MLFNNYKVLKMKMIKRIVANIKNFFSNLFNKKAKKMETKQNNIFKQIEMISATLDQAVDSVTVPVAQDNEDNGKVFDRIMALTKTTGYRLSEALNAFINGNNAELVRIEREMNAGTYIHAARTSAS